MYSETLKKYLLNELKDTSSSVLTGTINHSFIRSVLDAIKFLTSSEKRNRSIEETKNIIVSET
ncbi:MAG: hypothetical protein QXK24_00765 [Ignisphaera sp.]|uniref:Uncharacterized protein n=1 Tax=Ignisphaera aggregans TaxID=334771 RepID=A0A7C4D1R1_9CREN